MSTKIVLLLQYVIVHSQLANIYFQQQNYTLEIACHQSVHIKIFREYEVTKVIGNSQQQVLKLLQMGQDINIIIIQTYSIRAMAQSYGICTTGTKRKAEKISIYFDDKIKTMKVIKMSLFPWIRIDQLKKQLAISKFQNHVAWNDLRLFYKNLELTPNHRRFFDFGVQPDSMILIKTVQTDKEIQMGIVNPYHIFDCTPASIKNLILQVQSGLNNGKKPKLADDGTSGTYFLENHLKKTVAIFKPFDEQPYAENNPRNIVGKTGSVGIRKGILSGESATRQVAAFLLDQQRFHGVPQTTFVEFFHPSFLQKEQISNPIACDPQRTLNKQNRLKTKHGSLQIFAENQDIAGNMGSNQFSIEEVHKIGILDLRILNCDRNDANILVKKLMVGKEKPKKYLKLIPIDHGLTFPDNFEIYDYEMVWMTYSQAKQPFSQKSLKFIEGIDPAKDCNRLRQKLGFRQICLRNFRIAQTFLKRMAKQGFTLYEIGTMVYRKQDDDDYIDSEGQQQPAKIKGVENLSDLQKLVNSVQNIYFMIKENGIKSTINFQIMFTKPKKCEDQPALQKTQKCKERSRQRERQTQRQRQREREKSEEKKSTSIQKSQKSCKKAKNQNLGLLKLTSKLSQSPNKNRNVSLPNLKVNNREQKALKTKRKMKKKIEVQDRRFVKKRKQQEWDQVFFHYFNEFLERFVQDRNKKKRVLPSRQRLMSENIDYQI